MKNLVILAHPRTDSFAAAVAERAVRELKARGQHAELIDLYRDGFDPRMSAGEHRDYGDPPSLSDDLAGLAASLQKAEGLIFVFPTWWSGPPAILKGFFDRLFIPGVAFDVDSATSRMAGRLKALRKILVITTTGAPSWTIRLWLGNPVEKLFRSGIFAACAPKAKISVMMLHDMDASTPAKRNAFMDRIGRKLAKW